MPPLETQFYVALPCLPKPSRLLREACR